MSEYKEEIGSDQGIGMDQILREAECDTASWKKNDMPGTETLRRMILLADWASREPNAGPPTRCFTTKKWATPPSSRRNFMWRNAPRGVICSPSGSAGISGTDEARRNRCGICRARAEEVTSD